MTDMEKMMDYDRDSSGDKTTEKMMDEKMMDEKMTMKERYGRLFQCETML